MNRDRYPHATIQRTRTMKAVGSVITAAELRDFIDGLPDTAGIRITATVAHDQRDQSTLTFKADEP